MMGRRKRLDTDKASREPCENLQHLGAADALTHHHRAGVIDAMNLEYRLRYIETNRAHGRLPSKWFVSTQPPYGTPMPQSGRRPQHQKPTWRRDYGMSVLPSEADIVSEVGQVR